MKNKILVISSDDYVNGLIFTEEHQIVYIAESELINNKKEISLEDVKLIVFAGTNDVNPKLYNEERGVFTVVNNQRDVIEKKIYYHALDSKIPMLGINRGALLLTALQENGRIIQHITDHTQSHSIFLNIEKLEELELNIENLVKHKIESLNATSDHHQLMYPYNVANHFILAYADALSSTYLDGESNEIEMPEGRTALGINITKEPEIVYYKNTNCLCVQSDCGKYSDRAAMLQTQLIDSLVLSSIVNEILLKNNKIKFLDYIGNTNILSLLNTGNLTFNSGVISVLSSNYQHFISNQNSDKSYIEFKPRVKSKIPQKSLTERILSNTSKKSDETKSSSWTAKYLESSIRFQQATPKEKPNSKMEACPGFLSMEDKTEILISFFHKQGHSLDTSVTFLDYLLSAKSFNAIERMASDVDYAMSLMKSYILRKASGKLPTNPIEKEDLSWEIESNELDSSASVRKPTIEIENKNAGVKLKTNKLPHSYEEWTDQVKENSIYTYGIDPSVSTYKPSFKASDQQSVDTSNLIFKARRGTVFMPSSKEIEESLKHVDKILDDLNEGDFDINISKTNNIF